MLDTQFQKQAEQILSGSLEPTMEILVPILKRAEYLYRNSDEESFLTDTQYDILYRKAEKINPFHELFVNIGSDDRGDKQPLPITMPGLAQIYSADQNEGVSSVTKWIKDNNLEDVDIVIMDKLDGQSILHISNVQGLHVAFSKSNLTLGRDITRHVKKLKNVPKVWTTADENVAVRAEAVVPFNIFAEIQQSLAKRGKNYKNARNFVSGMTNSTESHDEFYEHTHLVAYEIMNSKLSKSEQLSKLQSLGWTVPYYSVHKGKEINDALLTKLVISAKIKSPYELDGVVLVVDDIKICERMGEGSTGTVEYARKFKIIGDAPVTEVVDVLWTPSKHGYAKPRVQIKPVELAGVTITFATGYNAAYIVENGIGPGAMVKITRAGDVIPKILETVKKATPKLPGKDFGDVYWSENDVDLILVNPGDNDEVKLYSIMDAFNRIEVVGLREASCLKLYEAGYNTVAKIIKAPKETFINIIGEANGAKIFESLHEKLMNIRPAVLAAASQSFGNGIGVRRMEKLYQEHGKIQGLTWAEVNDTESFSDITANLVIVGLDRYEIFLKEIAGFYNFRQEKVIVNGDLEGSVFVFTGYRNKEAEEEIVSRGGKIGSGVSKSATHLVAKDITGSSSKLVKAKELGMKILSPADLESLLK